MGEKEFIALYLQASDEVQSKIEQLLEGSDYETENELTDD